MPWSVNLMAVYRSTSGSQIRRAAYRRLEDITVCCILCNILFYRCAVSLWSADLVKEFSLEKNQEELLRKSKQVWYINSRFENQRKFPTAYISIYFVRNKSLRTKPMYVPMYWITSLFPSDGKINELWGREHPPGKFYNEL